MNHCPRAFERGGIHFFANKAVAQSVQKGFNGVTIAQLPAPSRGLIVALVRSSIHFARQYENL
jgi:hypothetical protein